MKSATSSPLHVRQLRRRASSLRIRRVILKTLIVGAGGVAIFGLMTSTVVLGLRRMHGVALAIPADGSRVIAFTAPPSRLAWTAPADSRGARMLVVAGLPVPETVMATAARKDMSKQDEVEEEQFTTSSIAVHLPAISAPVIVSALSAIPDDVVATPLPQARPRLASLPSLGNPALAPGDDPRVSKTAIYDITAKTVYLPNGERLEAHSGLGPLMDDPRHVHRKMHGATPPNTYKLTMREALFHGVRALRMTPVGDGRMYNRDGILAHSYMLGPNGQSNGCVSFKDYPKFLRAYLRGEIDRIVVVVRLDKPPAHYARANARNAGSAL
jgi:hypothetical protein